MNEKLSKEALAAMKLGGRSKIFRCDNAADFESARRNAYHIKQNNPRPDGATYKITCSHKAMIVTVSLLENEIPPCP